MERIYRLAVTLLQDTEDVPEEFAKVLNDDFREITGLTAMKSGFTFQSISRKIQHKISSSS